MMLPILRGCGGDFDERHRFTWPHTTVQMWDTSNVNHSTQSPVQSKPVLELFIQVCVFAQQQQQGQCLPQKPPSIPKSYTCIIFTQPCLIAYLYQLKSTKSDLASSKTRVTSCSPIKDSNTRTQVETQVCTRSYPKPGTSKLPKRSLVKGEKFNDIWFATKNIVSCFPKERRWWQWSWWEGERNPSGHQNAAASLNSTRSLATCKHCFPGTSCKVGNFAQKHLRLSSILHFANIILAQLVPARPVHWLCIEFVQLVCSLHCTKCSRTH